MSRRNDDGWGDAPLAFRLVIVLIVAALALFAIAMVVWIIGAVTGMAIESWQNVGELLRGVG